ncbi:uncharacterized protein ColSpa_00722 [Colletotrichum spaethianum]|uniref:Cyclase n=1 Tax=Colletotrichum spaethianum TaxID=700344 RepID=A0AA37L232_9PEZI|nr:uncharacterized protein ColSpa_00722 [Colletotrichum spaethianum]GKT40541.1 hypothetical protein ColSpa_00722 [Colletotrichum spaethianum]
MSAVTLPDYDDLPPVEGMPKGCAWGVFDKDGKKDLYGTLNLLTPEIIRAAGAEVRDGVSISLNWPLDSLNKLNIPGRKQTAHHVHSLQAGGLSQGLGWDDELEFNTQGSSQWDSLVHWQHQATGLAYNGFKPTQEELSATFTADNKMPTIDHWHERGGVVGRGVLIDYKAYTEAKGIDYHPLDGYPITIDDIEAVAAYQGVEFKHGDIFLLRTGVTAIIDNPSPADFEKMAQSKLSGVLGTEETAKWFWNKHFAAVAGDANAFEAYQPANPNVTEVDAHSLVLHPYFLSLFGMPIGELWDLSRLSAYCKMTGRYSFLLTSAPMNVSCLIGSPPNALAIF